jgi:hypothetical protein
MTPPSDSLFFSDGQIEVHVGDYQDVIPRRLAELGVEPGDVALVHADPPYGTGDTSPPPRSAPSPPSPPMPPMPPLAPTDASLITVRPKFGCAGGPDEVVRTDKGAALAFAMSSPGPQAHRGAALPEHLALRLEHPQLRRPHLALRHRASTTFSA